MAVVMTPLCCDYMDWTTSAFISRLALIWNDFTSCVTHMKLHLKSIGHAFEANIAARGQCQFCSWSESTHCRFALKLTGWYTTQSLEICCTWSSQASGLPLCNASFDRHYTLASVKFDKHEIILTHWLKVYNRQVLTGWLSMMGNLSSQCDVSMAAQ